MTQEDKNLLFKELCSRLPYKLICNVTDYTAEREEDENFDACLLSVERTDSGGYTTFIGAAPEYPVWHNLQQLIKPYLRPMSSMTEEEKEELLNLLFDKEAKCFYIDEEGLIDGKTSYLMKEGLNYPAFCPINIVLYTDWLTAHHFDYRGLIPMGLALEAPEDMYKNETVIYEV